MVKEYRESDFDTRPKKEMPVDVFIGLIVMLVVSIIICFALVVWVLK